MDGFEFRAMMVALETERFGWLASTMELTARNIGRTENTSLLVSPGAPAGETPALAEPFVL